jgi:hypothetical protein
MFGPNGEIVQEAVSFPYRLENYGLRIAVTPSPVIRQLTDQSLPFHKVGGQADSTSKRGFSCMYDAKLK